MKKQSTAHMVKAAFAKSRYVVMKSITDRSIVAYGNNLVSVLKKANRAGVQEPFVLFPHDPSKRYVYV